MRLHPGKVSAMLPTHAALSPFLRGLCMARGRRTSLTICLTAKERRTLLAWQHSQAIPVGQARRGRMILLVARRVPISHLADTVGVSRRFVYKWVRRFQQDGLAGLADKPSRGNKPGLRPYDIREQPDVAVG